MITEFEWHKIVRTTSCPTCKAKPGERCRARKDGSIQPNHASRIELFRKVEAELHPKKDRWLSMGATDSE
jgi:hypothetical protein